MRENLKPKLNYGLITREIKNAQNTMVKVEISGSKV